jgi:hypothetical protein
MVNSPRLIASLSLASSGACGLNGRMRRPSRLTGCANYVISSPSDLVSSTEARPGGSSHWRPGLDRGCRGTRRVGALDRQRPGIRPPSGRCAPARPPRRGTNSVGLAPAATGHNPPPPRGDGAMSLQLTGLSNLTAEGQSPPGVARLGCGPWRNGQFRRDSSPRPQARPRSDLARGV